VDGAEVAAAVEGGGGGGGDGEGEGEGEGHGGQDKGGRGWGEMRNMKRETRNAKRGERER
jgi:hypothetical protein